MIQHWHDIFISLNEYLKFMKIKKNRSLFRIDAGDMIDSLANFKGQD